MKRTTRKDLREHLRALGLKKGDNVWVQSRLLAFGLLEGGMETVYAAFRDVIGEEGTLAVATYRWSAPADEPYDPATSPSLDLGPFSEYVRQLPGAVRSLAPMHSHAAVGPLAGILKLPDGHQSFGPGSDYEQLLKHDFINVYLGLAGRLHEAATYPIHVQACLGNIPYREWIDLQRLVVINGKAEPFMVRYYARRDRSAREDLGRAYPLLRKHDALRQAPCAYGASCAVPLSVYHEIVEKALSRDPLFFLRDHQPEELR